jgi:hypothetical protein
MRVPQHVLVFGELIDQLVERCLDGRRRSGPVRFRRHLARWQPQVQRNRRTLPRVLFLNDGVQMHQLGAEELEPLPHLVDLLVEFFFEVGSFGNLVADVDIHAEPRPQA